MSIEKDLLELFAANTVEAIERDNGLLLRTKFHTESIEELGAMRGYIDSFAFIRDCKCQLERILTQYHGEPSKQIKACLETIYDAKTKERRRTIEGFHALAKRSVYETAWNEQERVEFDRKFEFIVNWKDFFLSYTNRDAILTNNKFTELISFALDGSVSDEDRQTTNLVARIVAKLFEQNGLKSFFDYANIKSGDDIQEKIRDCCGDCFAFIQIVEAETFAEPVGGKENWCFEEYIEFKKNAQLRAQCGLPAEDKHFHFMITLDTVQDVRPVNLKYAYQDWFDHMARIKAKPIESDYAKLRKVVREVATEIVQLWRAAVDEILS